MAESNLTPERLRELLHYDPETGIFTRKAVGTKYGTTALNKRYTGKLAGTVLKSGAAAGYWAVSADGVRWYAHRLAWFYVHGRWPDGDIDHISGDRADNRIANLRDVPHSTNIQNQRRASKRSGSGLMGAHWHVNRQRWKSSIYSGGKQIHLGYHDTAQEAHEAYLTAKRRLHEGCTI